MSRFKIGMVCAVVLAATLALGGQAWGAAAPGALVDLQAGNNARATSSPAEWANLGTLGGWITAETGGGSGEPVLVVEPTVAYYSTAAASGGSAAFGRTRNGGAGLAGNEPRPLLMENITVEMWARRQGAAMGVEHQVFGLRSLNHTQRFTMHLSTSTNEMLMTIMGQNDSPPNEYSTGVTMAADGNFHQYVMTYDDANDQFKMIVDNGTPTTIAIARNFSASVDWESLSLFKEFSIEANSRRFNGDISLFRVYDRVLTPAEIAGNFAAGPSVPEPASLALLGLGGLALLRRRAAS